MSHYKLRISVYANIRSIIISYAITVININDFTLVIIVRYKINLVNFHNININRYSNEVLIKLRYGYYIENRLQYLFQSIYLNIIT